MKLKDFSYTLPREFIAQYPSERRGDSKLLVLERRSERIEHRRFGDIVDYLSLGDVLCINNTRVIPARILGRREKTGGKVEVFLLKEIQDGLWEVLIKPSKRARAGERFVFENSIGCRVEERNGVGTWRIRFLPETLTKEDIYAVGKTPLPPYIKREPEELDNYRYQTVYAEEDGSVAAPTAGLHFTDEIIRRIEERGVQVVKILLHVGLGTFRPVKAENIAHHRMESEYYELDEESVARITEARNSGGEVFVVGTTTTRALETAFYDGSLHPGTGWTEKFIYPPYEFKVVDHLITNFHLPQTTLLMLVSAFATLEVILKAYEEAKKEGYRFFSYGDAMLIL
jgi:S-adenosylmethionine:tRNA ribosyltransferase-isomerase